MIFTFPLTEMTRIVKIAYVRYPFILYNQYPGYWWPCDVTSQGISSQGIHLVFPNFLALVHSDGLVQDCSLSVANALGIRQSCIKPLIMCYGDYVFWYIPSYLCNENHHTWKDRLHIETGPRWSVSVHEDRHLSFKICLVIHYFVNFLMHATLFKIVAEMLRNFATLRSFW